MQFTPSLSWLQSLQRYATYMLRICTATSTFNEVHFTLLNRQERCVGTATETKCRRRRRPLRYTCSMPVCAVPPVISIEKKVLRAQAKHSVFSPVLITVHRLCVSHSLRQTSSELQWRLSELFYAILCISAVHQHMSTSYHSLLVLVLCFVWFLPRGATQIARYCHGNSSVCLLPSACMHVSESLFMRILTLISANCVVSTRRNLHLNIQFSFGRLENAGCADDVIGCTHHIALHTVCWEKW